MPQSRTAEEIEAKGLLVGGGYTNRPRQSDLYACVSLAINGIPINVNDHLQALEITEEQQASSHGQLTLYDRRWDYLENLLQRVGRQAPVDVQLGFRGHWGPRIQMLTGTYRASFTNAGVTINLQMVDSGFMANLEARTKGYPLNRYPRISDIVQEIAERNRWDYVIEETGTHEEPIRQNYLPDTQFMVHVLQEQARNPNGRGGYRCFLERSSILHFHTQYFLLNDQSAIYRTYTYAKELDGEVLEFTPGDLEIEAAALGAGDADFESFDPRLQEVVTVQNRARGRYNDMHLGQGRISAVTGVDHTFDEETGTWSTTNGWDRESINRWVTRPFNNPQQLHRYAEHRKTYFEESRFQANLTVFGDPFIRPQTLVRIYVIKEDGQPHARWSGQYLIKTVKHDLKPGSYTTMCELQRESVGTGDVDIYGTTVNTRARGWEHRATEERGMALTRVEERERNARLRELGFR